MKFIQSVIKRAKSDKKTIVLPESKDSRIVKAASILQKSEIAEIILIGERKNICKFAPDVDLSEIEIINPLEFEKTEEYSNFFYELRKSKGMTIDKARELMKDPLYFSVMLVKMGVADGMVAGAVNSTSNTLRPALQILKTLPGTKIVSSFFIMVVPNCEYGDQGTFIYADCGLVENPNSDELSEIAISSAKSFKRLVRGEPKIALLSYSTHGSADSELTRKVVRAKEIAKDKRPDLIIDGEMQADAAIVPSIGMFKAAGSPVAGKANVLIFPDLNCGNIAYKITQRLAKAQAYGPITQGIAKPVNDLSRGCCVEDIVGVVAITAVQAQITESAKTQGGF